MAVHHSAAMREGDSDGNAELTRNHEVNELDTFCNCLKLSKQHTKMHTLDRNNSLGNVEIENFESGG